MPTAAIATAALVLVAGLEDREVRDLMLSLGNAIAVCAFIGGLAFFLYVFNRRSRRR